MIRNIPTHDDFYKTGRELLDLSWGMVAKLLVNLDEAEYYGIDADEVSEEYCGQQGQVLRFAFPVINAS